MREDELIAAIRRVAGTGPGVVVGIGDDAAVLSPGTGESVVTTDVLVQGVHFTSAIAARDLGAKAIAVNVSDIAAMGASPRWVTCSLAMPEDTEPSWVVELAGGMKDACDEYACSLVGGDLSRGDAIFIAVTVGGEVAPGRAVLRSGARPGDALVVTGELGAAAGGRMLEERPDLVGSHWARGLLEAHHRPVARVAEGFILAGAGASAMMDVSDGLLLDASRLCAASGVGARLDLDAVPVAADLRPLAGAMGIDALDLALRGGEDYELLAAVAPEAVEGLIEAFADRTGTSLTRIGEIVAADGLMDASGAALEPAGWDHFA